MEAKRQALISQADKLPGLEKVAKKRKVVWKKALEKEKELREGLKQEVRSAKKAMDAAYASLSQATMARNTLRAEFTPKDLREKETILGVAYRTHKQHRERAESDVNRMREGLKMRDHRRKGFMPDRETKEQDYKRLTYLESIVADVAEKEEAAHDAWRVVVKELDDAYGQAIRQAPAS